MRGRTIVLGMDKVVLAVCIFVATARFAPAQTSPQSNPSPDAHAIISVLETQVAAWNRGDIPAFMEGYWKSEDLEFVNAAGIFQGWQDVLQRYQRSYPDRAAMGHLTFSGVEVHVLCADTGYVVGRFRLDREMAGKKDHPEGVFTLIFRKFPQGWKIINDHTTEFPERTSAKKPS